MRLDALQRFGGLTRALGQSKELCVSDLNAGINYSLLSLLLTSQDIFSVIRHSSKQLPTIAELVNVHFFIIESDNGHHRCPCHSTFPYGSFSGIFVLIIVYHGFVTIVFNNQLQRVMGVIIFVSDIVTVVIFDFTFF